MRILRLLFVALVLSVWVACDPVTRESKEPQEGFNINGLLDSLERQVVSGNPLLTKRAVLNGEADSTQMRLDSTGWRREFQVFDDMKLTPGRLKGRYDVSIIEGDTEIVHRYIAKDPKYQQLDSFFITTDLQEKPKQLEVYVRYSNSLNATEKQLLLVWDTINAQRLPAFYKTRGWQKMKMSDPIDFEIEARLTY